MEYLFSIENSNTASQPCNNLRLNAFFIMLKPIFIMDLQD
jgi:hypothetical protein